MQNDLGSPAQAPNGNPRDDSGSPDPSSSGDGGAPAGTRPPLDDRALQERLRERGRNEALQARIDALQEQNRMLQGQLGGIVTKITADEERAWEANLARMDPADRANAIATRAMEENRALRRQLQQGRPSGPAVDPVAYKERRSREMVEAANQRYGLTGDAAMTVDDFDEEDLMDEKTFQTALRVESRLRAQGGAVPRKKTETEDDRVERRVQEELRKHGVAAPVSAKPAGASGRSGGNATEEDIQATLRNTRGAPRDKVAALRAMEIKVDRPGRR